LQRPFERIFHGSRFCTGDGFPHKLAPFDSGNPNGKTLFAQCFVNTGKSNLKMPARCSPDPAQPVFLWLFHQHIQYPSNHPILKLAGQVGLDLKKAPTAIRFGFWINGLLHFRGVSAFAGAIRKKVNLAKAGLSANIDGLFEVGFSFSRKAINDIGGQRGFVKDFPYPLAIVQERIPPIAPAHGGKDPVRTRLKAKVEVRNHPFALLEGFEKIFANFSGLEAGKPYAKIAFERIKPLDQVPKSTPLVLGQPLA
jgi:hypothetical protein